MAGRQQQHLELGSATIVATLYESSESSVVSGVNSQFGKLYIDAVNARVFSADSTAVLVDSKDHSLIRFKRSGVLIATCISTLIDMLQKHGYTLTHYSLTVERCEGGVNYQQTNLLFSPTKPTS